MGEEETTYYRRHMLNTILWVRSHISYSKIFMSPVIPPNRCTVTCPTVYCMTSHISYSFVHDKSHFRNFHITAVTSLTPQRLGKVTNWLQNSEQSHILVISGLVVWRYWRNSSFLPHESNLFCISVQYRVITGSKRKREPVTVSK